MELTVCMHACVHAFVIILEKMGISCSPIEVYLNSVRHQIESQNLTDVRSGEGNGNPFQCSCLENPIDKGAWWARVHGVTKSWTQLSD